MTEKEIQAERRKGVVLKLKRTRPGETVCLAYWEVEAVLDYINRLKGVAGNAKVQAADGKSANAGVGRG